MYLRRMAQPLKFANFLQVQCAFLLDFWFR